MRSIRVGSRTLVASEVLRSYWHVAAERQRIYHRRLAGDEAPWSEDTILSTHRFTNAYRAADRVSQELIHIQYKGSQEAEDLMLRTLLFRFFNKPDTWNLIEQALGNVSMEEFDVPAIDKVLEQAMLKGERVYSPAYIIPPPPFGARRKHLNHLRLIEHMLTSGAADRIYDARDLQEVYEILLSYPSLGPFLAFQLAVDVNYSSLVNFDENEFVVAGPGARSGVAKCFVDTDGLSAEDVIRWMVDNQDDEFARYGFEFQDLFGRSLALIDCQNLFCETDKYARVAHPEASGVGARTRIKQRYTPTHSRLTTPFFPPKWGINNAVQAALTGHLPDEALEMRPSSLEAQPSASGLVLAGG